MYTKRIATILLTATAMFTWLPVISIASSFFFVDNSGNVGIGTDSPQAKLDVSGTMYSRLVSLTATTSTAMVNWNAGNVQSLTLDANTTLSFSNGQAGGKYDLIVNQDGTGGRTITWPASVKWPTGGAPTLTSGANSTDLISFVYDGTNYLGTYSLDEEAPVPISFDNAANTTVNNNTSGTLTISTSGSDRMLVVSISSEGSSDPSSVTYNGVSMTKAVSTTTPADTSIWYLINPSSGSHNVSVSFGSVQYFQILAVSLDGVDQTTGIGVTGVNGSVPNVGSGSVTLSTTHANSWIVDTLGLDTNSIAGDRNPTASGTDQTRRNETYISTSGFYFNAAQSTQTTTSTGNYTTGYNWTGTDNYAMAAVEILPKH